MSLIEAIVENEPKALNRINEKMTTAPIACSQKPAKLFIKTRAQGFAENNRKQWENSLRVRSRAHFVSKI